MRSDTCGASTFDPRATGQRGALQFSDGKVFVPFGGLYGDCGMYHGWVVGIDVANPAQQVAFATPGRGSGIWAVGGSAMDAIARQPEAYSKIQLAMIISAALIEGAALFAIVVAMIKG